MLIRIRQTDEEPEIPRSLASCTGQEYMGANAGKMRRSKSIAEVRIIMPMERIAKRHPDHKKWIPKYMEKWNKRTTGGLRWPKEGTFNLAYCNEVGTVITHHKPRDMSDKR